LSEVDKMGESSRGNNIVVMEDGGSGVKLTVFDAETFQVLHHDKADTDGSNAVFPGTKTIDGREYVNTHAEFSWFDESLRKVPAAIREDISVIANVSRGGTMAFIGAHQRIIDCPTEPGLVASYAHQTPSALALFERLYPTDEDKKRFFDETGSPTGPGFVWGKRALELETDSRLKSEATAVAPFTAVLAGHWLGGDYISAVATSGKGYDYMLCHSALVDVNGPPGTLSSFARLPEVQRFMNLLPSDFTVTHQVIGHMPPSQRDSLGLTGDIAVPAGVHDTTASHIPVWAAFDSFNRQPNSSVIHVELGSWDLCKDRKSVKVPNGGHKQGLLAQGSVDGEPGLTSLYGGGFDFRYLRKKVHERHPGGNFGLKDGVVNEKHLEEVASTTGGVVLPNIDPTCQGVGPWADLKGRIDNPKRFFKSPEDAYLITNLMVASAVAKHVDLITLQSKDVPIVLTGGGAEDPLAGRLLATMTGRKVYLMVDDKDKLVTGTTALGAAMIAKAAVDNTHPNSVDIGSLGITFRELKTFEKDTAKAICKYRTDLTKAIDADLRRLSPSTIESAQPAIKNPRKKIQT
jgi:sugar (pentulose or hexulose) kinase